MKYCIIILFTVASTFVGQYFGSASLRSEIWGFDINKDTINGQEWYFVYHEGLIETVFTSKVRASKYVELHKKYLNDHK